MLQLPPLIVKEHYYSEIEKEIQRIFDRLIYQPVFESLGTRMKEFKNSANALLDAIAMGNVWYQNGEFYGQYSAKITKELMRIGATFKKSTRTWRLEQSHVPSDVKFAQATADARYNRLCDKLLNTLDNVDIDNVDLISQTTRSYEKTLSSMESDLQKTIPKGETNPTDAPATARSKLVIEAQLTDAMKEKIAEEWSDNLDLYIKKWSQDNILSLRQSIQTHILDGGRAQSLVKMISENYGVSQRKAKFLARQETALLMSKFQESRYKDMGIEEYRWSGANDARERPDHRKLNGKVFRWDNPPITDQKTGARNNPGEDWNCFPGNSRINIFGRIEKCFRRWYCGELTQIILESGETIRATPNHPMLTVSGWKPISKINESDYIIKIPQELLNSSETDANQGETSIREIFKSLRESFLFNTAAGHLVDFHGDGSTRNIDIIDATRNLGFYGDIKQRNSINNLLLSLSDFFAMCISRFFEHLCSFGFWYSFASFVRRLSKFASFFKGKLTHSNFVSLRNASDGNTIFNKPSADNNTFKAGTLRDGKFTFTRDISIDDGFHIELQSVMATTLDRVISVRSALYIGHIYNLQVDIGYYTATSAIVSNCRCVAIPVIR